MWKRGLCKFDNLPVITELFPLCSLLRALCSVGTVEALYLYWLAGFGLVAGYSEFSELQLLPLQNVRGSEESASQGYCGSCIIHYIRRSFVNWKLCWMMDYKLEVLWWSRKATPFGKRDWFFFPLETETFLYVGWELALDVSLPPALGNARTSCPCMVGRQRSKGEILKWPFWSSEHKEPWATQ